ncbi:FAD-dependent oxidoreductase [Corynebacterium suedekumii]|uniref:FAD-dependent oxidoreductase n=1 Tax=Corynebacterium suedekumii TaxID=3049801 RepID=A0ABY8VST9_9CORY|nr:FAD-dependent oxidoreductase [Corynebacterium suedekumii]WIM71224.1 FAD-dependent oxidoreductase [Corynebacterium suedekumii]
MTTPTTTTVIVGGVAGGMSTAARLRRRDETMEIIVLEASGHVSFANCGLPYHVSGVIPERSSLLLQTPDALRDRFNLDVRVNHRVTAVDRANQTVTVRDETDGREFTQAYDHLVLSPGATPVRPPIPGIERALTLRTVEDVDAIIASLDENVHSVAVVGGGFIGLELAENLRHRDLNVTVLERGDQIMAPLDPEMAALVTDHLREHGVTVETGADATEITADGVRLADGRHIDADLVIAAIGVTPESSLARAAGLKIGERGGISVDDQLRTSDPAIFALGDAAEKRDAVSGEDTLVPLAQTANRHGRLVADIITGRDVSRTATLGTAIVGIFGLAAASVGWNEKRARTAGRDIRLIHVHPVDHAGYYPGAEMLHLKLVVDAATDAILGAQAVGMGGVDKRIDVIATAMRAGLTATDLADLELAYAPQFGSAKDPVNMLGFVNDNIINGEKTMQWHEVADAVADGWTLVDVRTPEEFNAGTIPGAINLPLDDLRERRDELAGRRALVFCRVGQRGHVAASLLGQLGVTVANLDGGFLTWSSLNAGIR